MKTKLIEIGIVIILLALASICFAAWDNTLPADGDSVYGWPASIRANWDALEAALGVDLDMSGIDFEVAEVNTLDLITISPWIDVRAYNADPTGAADSTVAIQNAINAATVGSTVYFPPGTYQFTNLVISDSIRLQGAGATRRWRGTSATILQHTGALDAFTLDNATAEYRGAISLRDFELIPSVADTGRYGISIVQTSTGSMRSIDLTRLAIRNFGSSAVYASGTVFDVTLDRVYIEGNVGDGIVVVAGVGNPSQWKFLDCFLLSDTGAWAVNLALNLFDFQGGTVAGGGNGIHVHGNGSISGMNIEGISVGGSIGLQFIGNNCDVRGSTIYLWDVGVTIGDGTVAVARGFHFVGDLNGNVTYDIDLTAGGNRQYTYVHNLGNAQGYTEPVVNNQRETATEAYGELWIESTGRIPIGRVNPIFYTIPTLSNDATPSVAGSTVWLTGGVIAITDFDDGVQGQMITIIAEHGITITDGTNIFLNASANFAMTATDTLTLICKLDNKWYEVSRGDNGA